MLLCDAHADTLYNLQMHPGKPTDLTLERLKKGGVSLQTLAMYVGEGRKGDVEGLMLGMLDRFAELKAAGWTQLLDPSEAKDGQTGVMLSIEGCEPFEPGLSIIDEYRALGVRMAAITWNHENGLGYPALSGSEQGLKPYGLDAVRRMQKLGIAVDVSHLNERGFYDILNKTDAPPLASHSCCAALKPHPRNLTDRQLRDLFAAGGYVGVNFYPAFLTDGVCTMDTLIDHIDHMHQMGGEGKIGFGSDFDGIERKPEGLDNPEDYPALLAALEHRGYSGQALRDIAGMGFLAYYQRISGTR